MICAVLAGSLAFANFAVSTPIKPDGYLAEPKSGNGPGVLVLHPWWGLNADVKTFCDRLAGSGFVAFAPDLFHGRTAETEEAAEALVKAHDAKAPELLAQIGEGAKFLAEKTGKPGIAVVGFSFGAYYALEFSNREPERVKSVVVYYGTGADDFSKSKASYLGHFAEKDDFEPKKNIAGLADLLSKAHRTATLHFYPEAGHWFAEPSVTKAYRKEDAEMAWTRTLEFLRKNSS